MADHDVSYAFTPLSEKEKVEQLDAHVRTYRGFLAVTKWTTIVIVAILLILYFFFIV